MNSNRISKSLFQLFALFFAMAIIVSCNNNPPPAETENKEVEQKTITRDFVFEAPKDSVVNEGEYIKRYKNGIIEMQGMMKDGKRDGIWKSWYEDGSPWSETTFAAGKKNGRTITWYSNKQKRYEGFYTNDKESGKWQFWDEAGKALPGMEY
jgi:hypothetical protein